MRKILLVIGLALVVVGCQPNNPQPTAPNATTFGSMTCTLNGVGWSATTFNNKLELNLTDGVTTAKRLELMGKNSAGEQITLKFATLVDPGEGNMPVGTYLSQGTTSAGGASYFSGGINTGVSTGSNVGDAVITVTAIDEVNNACSGTFEFLIHDNQTGNVIYTCTNGEFTSLIYTVN